MLSHLARPVRHALGVGVLVATLSAGGALTPTSASAAPTRSTQLSITATPQRLASAGNVGVASYLTAGQGLNGEKVVLEGRHNAQEAWVALAAGRTYTSRQSGRSGYIYFTVSHLSYDYQLRVHHSAGSTPYAASASSVRTIAVGGPRTFTARASSSTTRSGFELIPGDKVG